MQKFNYHTHTRRCGHADDSMTDEDFVRLLIEKGIVKMAFTDHCPEKEEIDYRKNMRMKYSEKEEYLERIKSLKDKYKDEIEKETDKIIIGQHFIYDENNNIKLLTRQKYIDEDVLKYAEYIKVAIEKNIPDIIAHPDIYMLGRNTFTNIDAKAAHIICAVAEKYEIPLEINLSHPNECIIGKRNDIIYPCKEFWKIASEYNNLKVLYGIDAHFKYQIINYEKAIEIANNHIGQDIIKKLHFCDENLDI